MKPRKKTTKQKTTTEYRLLTEPHLTYTEALQEVTDNKEPKKKRGNSFLDKFKRKPVEKKSEVIEDNKDIEATAEVVAQ